VAPRLLHRVHPRAGDEVLGYAGIPEGRVHFAGEHTSTYSQGFLNGGVESGQRAAIEVLLALGLPVPPAVASLPYSRIPGQEIGVGDRW
jgi:Flavin containing amine oxidoreductase